MEGSCWMSLRRGEGRRERTRKGPRSTQDTRGSRKWVGLVLPCVRVSSSYPIVLDSNDFIAGCSLRFWLTLDSGHTITIPHTVLQALILYREFRANSLFVQVLINILPSHRDFWKEVPYMLKDVVSHLCSNVRPRRTATRGGYIAV